MGILLGEVWGVVSGGGGVFFWPDWAGFGWIEEAPPVWAQGMGGQVGLGIAKGTRIIVTLLLLSSNICILILVGQGRGNSARNLVNGGVIAGLGFMGDIP